MLILASASPRRRELLTQAGFTFEVRPAHIPEETFPGEEPGAYVMRLAREKAEAVYEQLVPQGLKPHSLGGLDVRAEARTLQKPFETQAREKAEAVFPALQVRDERASAPPQVVLGADTTVTVDGLILEKPRDAADATRMLRMLAGRSHRVITGVALVSAAGTQVAAETTEVEFLPLSDAEIAEYVATGEPMDKAGAYAIQGRAARWIPRIVGDYSNVVGLPLALVSRMLSDAHL